MSSQLTNPFKSAFLGVARATVVFVAVAAAFPALAQAPSPAPTTELFEDPLLRKLVDESMAARPEVQAAEAQARAQRERVPQAGALPDPTITLGIQNDGFSSIAVGKAETSWYTILLSQGFYWPGKRGLRTDAAELGAKQALQSVSRQRLTTEAEVRRAYVDLVLARDRLTLLDELEALWNKSAQIAQTRYTTGQAVQSDVLRAQLELNRLRQRRWSLQATERVSVQALNRLRVHPLDEPIATQLSLREAALVPLPDYQAAIDDAERRSPELLAARLGLEQAQTLVALARRERYPDFSLSAGVMPRGALETMWTASVGVNLPIWSERKQWRAVSESEQRATSSERDLDAVRLSVDLRAQERRTALVSLLDTLRLYIEGLLVQSRATADSTLAQYLVGRVTFASVLEANAGYLNDYEGYLANAADAQRIAIAAAEVSLDPVGVGSSAGGLGNTAMPGSGPSPSGGAAAAPAPAEAAGAQTTAASSSSSKM